MTTRSGRVALHPLSRGAWAAAFVSFGIVLVTRLIGIGSPPTMYFDEILFARSGAEYLGGKDPTEWTHPPLSKELIAASIFAFSNFRAEDSTPWPDAPTRTASDDLGNVAWVSSARLHVGSLDRHRCRLNSSRSIRIEFQPSVLAVGSRLVAVGNGDKLEAWALDGGLRLRVELPWALGSAAVLGDRVVVAGVGGELAVVSDQGLQPTTIDDAGPLVLASMDHVVWVSRTRSRVVAAVTEDGTIRRTLPLSAVPRSLAAPKSNERGRVPHTIRVVSQSRGTGVLESLDTSLFPGIEYRSPFPRPDAADRLTGMAPGSMTSDGSGLVWLASGSRLSVIEPMAMTRLASIRLSQPANTLIADATRSRAAVVGPRGLSCYAGAPATAWRLAGAAAGSAVAGLTVLLAVVLTGKVGVGLLAATLLALDGLLFTMSRFASPDVLLTSFLLALWISALVAARRVRERKRPVVPLALTGLFSGLAMATKWTAAVGIVAALAAAVLTGGRQWLALLRSRAVAVLGGGALVGLPAVVYVLTYLPFLARHSPGELLSLEAAMLRFHATAGGWDRMSSAWYWWPLGGKAILLYAGDLAGGRGEIWTVANPVLFLAGLAGAGIGVSRARRSRDWAGAIPLLAIGSYLLAWAVSPRFGLLYHYLPCVPFAAIAAARWSAPRRTFATCAVLAAAIVFAATMPLLSAQPVSTRYSATVRSGLRWEFPWWAALDHPPSPSGKVARPSRSASPH